MPIERLRQTLSFLYSPRLTYEVLQDSDLDYIASFQEDPALLDGSKTLVYRYDEMKEKFDHWGKTFQEDAFGVYRLNLRRQDSAQGYEFVGTAGLSRASEKLPFGGEPEVCFLRIGRQFENKGYGREATHRILDVAFSQLEVVKVWAVTSHEYAKRMFEKEGFIWDGEFNYKHLTGQYGYLTKSDWDASLDQ